MLKNRKVTGFFVLSLLILIILSCSSDKAENVAGDSAIKLINNTSKMIWYDISKGDNYWELYDPIWPNTVREFSYNYIARKYKGGESYVVEWWYKVKETEQSFTRSDIFSRQIRIETGRYTVIEWNAPDNCRIYSEDR